VRNRGDDMVRVLLLLAAAGIAVFGFQDYQRTSAELRATPLRGENCPRGKKPQVVRLQVDPAPAATVLYQVKADANTKFCLQALTKPAPGAHVVVRLSPAGPSGEPQSPGWKEPATTALLAPVPDALVPVDPQAAFPPGCTISMLVNEYEPSVAYPGVMMAAGALGLLLLLAPGMLAPKSKEAEQEVEETGPPVPDEQLPLHTVEPDTGTGLVLAVVCIALLAGTGLVRQDRMGGPGVWGNPLIAVIGCAAAMACGFQALRSAGQYVVLCTGGVRLTDDPAEPGRFLRWDQIQSLSRTGRGYTLTLRPKVGSKIVLNLGTGDDAHRIACCVAALLQPLILPRVRDYIGTGKELDLEQLRLSPEAIGWELTKGWRMNEFDDIQSIRIEDGVMIFKLPASHFDDLRTNYQELPNGFLLPILLLTGKKSAASECKLSWKSQTEPNPFLGTPMNLTGRDAWLMGPDSATAAILVRQGQFYLEESEKAAAAGQNAEALTACNRSLACFWASGEPHHKEIWKALLALGHYMLGQKQPAAARDAFQKAVKLIEADEKPDLGEIARAYTGLALARWRGKDPLGGLEEATRAAAVLQKGAPAPLLQRVMVYNMLAGLHQNEGHNAEAEAAMQQVMELLEGANPSELPENFQSQVLAYIQNYSQVAVDFQDTAMAESVHLRGVALCRKLFGEKCLLVGQGLFSLGTSQLACKKPAEAAATFEEAVTIFEKELDEKHPWMAGCLDRLGEAYWYAGRREEADGAWEISASIAAALPKDEAPTGGGH
jgi:tetratricopeptide (TPR) repeat protein